MITVSKQGDGDFTSIQEAVLSIPDSSSVTTVILIKPGLYEEKIWIRKNHLTLAGEDRDSTVIRFRDGARKKLGDSGKEYGTFHSATMFLAGDDISLSNLTIENTAGIGRVAGQAVAVYAGSDRTAFYNCALKGYQDTLYAGPIYPEEMNPKIVPAFFRNSSVTASFSNVRNYFRDCYLCGDVDFIFGANTALFEHCTIHSLKRESEDVSYITAASTPAGQEFGLVFSDCEITGEDGAGQVYLGRPWRDYAKTAFIGCRLGRHIHKAGWHNWTRIKAEIQLSYIEFGNTGEGADTSQRAPFCKALDNPETARYYTAKNILGGEDGWHPIRPDISNSLYSYSNPVVRGFFPDPSVIRAGDDFYMVNSTFQYFPAIPISHSRDMVHWHVIGHAITDPSWLDLSEIPDSHGIWAPDISYHEGTFYIFATLRLGGRGLRGNNIMRRQLMVTSSKPEGPYSRPTWLEVDSIDPSHFIDDDGSHYMVIAPGVRVIPLSEDCKEVLGEPRTVWAGTGEPCAEGPHIWKRDGWYYAILAEGGTGYGHGINIARSRELFGEYTACPYNPIMRQTDPEALIQRAGHGKPVTAPDGSCWMYYLCGRRNGGNYTTVGRETALDPITFTEDGWFTVNGGNGPSVVQTAPALPVQEYDRTLREEFNSVKLDSSWEFVRMPDEGSLSLTERPGCMRLYTTDGQLFQLSARNILVRREQELSYDVHTCLEFQPERDGEQAGLVCYYSTATYARFSLCREQERKLQLVFNRNNGEELAAEVTDIPDRPVHLRVLVRGLTRTFQYSYDGNDWITAGILEHCIYLCDEGIPEDRKRHTGTLVGIYASNGGCGSRIPADFDFFYYNDESPLS